ncbi:hypothetical protein Tco_0158667 [Tanacetum coccineum]
MRQKSKGFGSFTARDALPTYSLTLLTKALDCPVTASPISPPKDSNDKSGLDTSVKLTRAKLNKRSGGADLSKDKSDSESRLEFRRSWRGMIELRRNQAELDIYHR